MLTFFLVINSQSIDTFAGMVGSLEDRLWHAVSVCVSLRMRTRLFLQAYMYMCTHACRDQKPASNVISQGPNTLFSESGVLIGVLQVC